MSEDTESHTKSVDFILETPITDVILQNGRWVFYDANHNVIFSADAETTLDENGKPFS